LISECKIIEEAPNTKQFLKLRDSVDWGMVSDELASQSLANSLYSVSIYWQAGLIGMGRIVGDGHLYFYIQDVVVDPQYQGQGVGELIMSKIENYLSNTALEGATIGLFAVQGKETFYEKFGYKTRSGVPLGLGMCRFV
jgi:Acetyltransferases